MSYTATTEIEVEVEERLTDQDVQEVFDALDGVESIEDLEERHEIDIEDEAASLIDGAGTSDVDANCTIEHE